MAIMDDLVFCLKPRCPLCRSGRLYRPWTVSVVEKCDVCDAPLGEHDIGDGAAVFLIFILCFSIVPLSWVLELLYAPPLWVQVILWTIVSAIAVAVMLPATKAYIIMLEWRHVKKAETPAADDTPKAE